MCSRAALRAPERYYRIATAAVAGVGLLNLAVVNSRWSRWVAVHAENPLSLHDPISRWPLWGVNALIVGLFGRLTLLFYATDRRQRRAGQSLPGA